MKQGLLILFIIGALFGCKEEKPSVICDLAKAALNVVSASISAPWECNQEKVYAIIATPITDKLCSGEKSILPVKQICNIGLNALASMGKEQLVSKFSCNPDKIDFSQINKICDGL
jgi:hypothetical protein